MYVWRILMHMDPVLHCFTGVVLAVLILGSILRKFNVPYMIAYIITGVIIGPFGLCVVEDHAMVIRLESIGVFLLLFFVGMKVSIPKLLSDWKVEVVGTLLQITASVLLVGVLAFVLDWSVARAVLLGFVIGISSTAVVLKILEDRNQLDSDVGKKVVGILIIQDMMLIPMIIIIEFLGGKVPTLSEISMQILGGVAMIGIFACLLVWAAVESPRGSGPKSTETHHPGQPAPHAKTVSPDSVASYTGEDVRQERLQLTQSMNRPTLAPPPVLATTSYGQVIEVEVVVEQAPASSLD